MCGAAIPQAIAGGPLAALPALPFVKKTAGSAVKSVQSQVPEKSFLSSALKTVKPNPDGPTLY